MFGNHKLHYLQLYLYSYFENYTPYRWLLPFGKRKGASFLMYFHQDFRTRTFFHLYLISHFGTEKNSQYFYVAQWGQISENTVFVALGLVLIMVAE